MVYQNFFKMQKWPQIHWIEYEAMKPLTMSKVFVGSILWESFLAASSSMAIPPTSQVLKEWLKSKRNNGISYQLLSTILLKEEEGCDAYRNIMTN